MTLSINRALNFRPSPPVFRFSPANNTALFAGENRLTVYCGKGCVNSSSCTGGNQSFLFMAELGSTPRGRCQWIDTACLTQYCISFFSFYAFDDFIIRKLRSNDTQPTNSLYLFRFNRTVETFVRLPPPEPA